MPPKTCERARNQQPAVDLHPRVAGQKVADVFVGLKPLEDAALNGAAAQRRDDAGDARQFGFGGKRLAHCGDRMALEQRVGVNGETHRRLYLDDGRVERGCLASLREAQPVQRRMHRARCAQGAEFGCDDAVSIAHQIGRCVVRTIVGDHDASGRVGLLEKRLERHGQHGGFVAGGQDDGHCDPIAMRRGGPSRRPRSHQRPRVASNEDQHRGVVDDVSSADRPRRQPAAAEGEREQQHPQHQPARMDDRADPARPGRGGVLAGDRMWSTGVRHGVKTAPMHVLRYSRVAVVLHWLVAILIVANVALALVASNCPTIGCGP